MRKRICPTCGHPQGKGKTHGKLQHPPRAGRRANRRNAALSRGFAAPVVENQNSRGTEVAGTGKKRGDGEKGGSKKAKVAAPAAAPAS